MTLDRGFFERSATAVAVELIGVTINLHGRRFYIVEAEAYGAQEDPASHAHRGPTPRCAPMFEIGGNIYVYLSYGMHRCINFVTGSKGEGGAVLIRSLLEVLPSDSVLNEVLTLGPGRVGKLIGAELSWSGVDLFSITSPLKLESRIGEWEVETSKRVGISKGTDLEWRFYDSRLSRFVAKASR